MTAVTAGIRRIETVDAVVRTRFGQHARITGVVESSRCSAEHVSAPLDVVVTLESIGPSYGHTTAWASDLTEAEPGDVGSHPHRRGCECGQPYDETRGGFWYPVAATWQ